MTVHLERRDGRERFWSRCTRPLEFLPKPLHSEERQRVWRRQRRRCINLDRYYRYLRDRGIRFRVWWRVCGGATPDTFQGGVSKGAIKGRGVPTFSILVARRTFGAFSCIFNSDFIRSSWVVRGFVYSA